MMGRTHALTGAVAGLAAAPLAGADGPVETALVTVVCAGWALVPDLDHPTSSATRLLGPATRALSWGLRRATGTFYRLTKGCRDEAGEHRTCTHTALWGVLVAVAVGFAGTVSPWATLGVAGFGVALAADRLGTWLLAAALGGLGLWIGLGGGLDALLTHAGSAAWGVGVAAGLGCLVHSVGDAVTKTGAPLVFPLPIAGETYYEVRPPKPLRIATGGPIENYAITPACYVALLALAIPTAIPV